MRELVNLDGAVDLHLHTDPSMFDRRVDAIECGTECAAAGMDGFVLKCHHLPTIYGIPFINELLSREGESITPIGSVVLNYCNGGFNPFLVQTAIDFGARVVWMPTIDARNHAEAVGGMGNYPYGGKEVANDEYEGVSGLYALTDDGEIKPEVRSCIDKIVDNDVLLASGHISYEETLAIVEYAASRGQDNILVDHPDSPITKMNIEQQRRLIDLGATIERTFVALSPKFHRQSSEEVYEEIRAIGVDNCVISSDMGQIGNPSTPDALRMMGELLVEEGLSEEEYRTMIETNPKALIGFAE